LLGILAKQKDIAERRERSGKKGLARKALGALGTVGKLGVKAVGALGALGGKLGLGIIKKVGKVLFSALSPLKFVGLALMAKEFLSDGFNKAKEDFQSYKDKIGETSHGILSDMVGYSASLLSDASKWLEDVTGGVIPSIPKEKAFEYAQRVENALIKSFEVGSYILEKAYNEIKDVVGIDDKRVNEINQKIQDWISKKWDSFLDFTGLNEEGIQSKNQAIQDKLMEWKDAVNAKLTSYLNDSIDWVKEKLGEAKKALIDNPIESVKNKVSDITDGKVFSSHGTGVGVDELKKVKDEIRSITDDLYIVKSKIPAHRVQALFKESEAELEKKLLEASRKYNDLMLKRNKAIEDYHNINKNKINNVTNKKGGSISWRNNNSGNLKYEYADAIGLPRKHSMRSYEQALRKAQSLNSGVVALDRFSYAVFATKEDGDRARRKLVTKTYGNRTIASMLGKYSVTDYTGQANNKRYEKTILSEAKKQGVILSSTTKIKDFNEEQKNALLRGMEKHEGYRTGTAIDPNLNKNLADLVTVLKMKDGKDGVVVGGNKLEFVDDVGNQGRV